MNDIYYQRMLHSIRTFLGRWRGMDGELWDLTSNHRTLRILLRGRSVENNLVIACIDPQKINSPVHWKNNQLNVDICRLNDEDGFILMDKNIDLEIVCGGIEVKENMKLF